MGHYSKSLFSPDLLTVGLVQDHEMQFCRFAQGTEMMQNLQLYRGKKGMDTMFDHNEDSFSLCRLLCFSPNILLLGFPMLSTDTNTV